MDDEKYINPGISLYGQTVNVDGVCYVNTGRKGEMTDYLETPPPVFNLTPDHKCPCQPGFKLDAIDHIAQNDELGTGSFTGQIDTQLRRVDVIQENGHAYIEPRTNGMWTGNEVTTPSSWIYSAWVKPKEVIGNGHYEVTLWDHRENIGSHRNGVLISLSSNATANNGKLTVQLGSGPGKSPAWYTYPENPDNTYTSGDYNTWVKDVRYHVAVWVTPKRIRIFVNNELILDQSTIQCAAATAVMGLTTTNTLSPYPVSVESIRFYNQLPVDTVGSQSLISDHYNQYA